MPKLPGTQCSGPAKVIKRFRGSEIKGVSLGGSYKDYLRLGKKKNTHHREPLLDVIANFMVEDATGLSTITSPEAVTEFWGRPRA